MLLYAVTDRRRIAEPLPSYLARLVDAGVDYVQIREKDLSDRELYSLTQAAVELPRRRTKILVNERTDIALAARADGVHLPANSAAPSRVRRIAPDGFVIGVSCHSAEEARRAGDEGADFAVFGPVFETPAKKEYGPAQGLDRLERACRAATIPVMALGGVRLENAPQCLEAGAAGIAAISLFQEGRSPAEAAAALRELERPPA